MKKLFKLNNKGEYTHFPGVTIISGVDPRQLDLWCQVHACLLRCELAASHYAPLPFESYHMTAINLFVEAISASDEIDSWGSFLRKNRGFFHQLDDFCKKNQFVPEIEMIEVDVSASIRLHLRLPEHQKNLIRSFAHQFNLTARMPDVFHMTLGYKYSPCSLSQRQAIQDELQQGLFDIIHSYTEPLRLLTPTLSYFQNMTAFVPWDGQDYPFLTERPASLVARTLAGGRAVFFRSSSVLTSSDELVATASESKGASSP